MVPFLAKQSIVIKSGRDHNTILGNYECAYAVGLMSRLSGIAIEEHPEDLPGAMTEFIEKLQNYQTADEREKRLQHILSLYKVEPLADAQVYELLKMGLEEEHPWEM